MNFNKLLFILVVAKIFLFLPAMTIAQLNGINTINPSLGNYSGNPSGVPGKNFTSFTNAIKALKTYGINSQVVFNISAGTYNEQLFLPVISGSSSTNRIVFQSANGDSSSVILQYSARHTDTNYVFCLEDADYISIRKISIKALGSTYGIAVLLRNGADNDIIANNHIMSLCGQTAQFAGIFSTTSTDQYNLIENNLVDGGFYGIGLNGMSNSSLESGNVIRNNTVSNFFYYGIAAFYQDAVSITGNSITNSETSGIVYSIYPLNSMNAINISDNKIVMRPGNSSYGIYLNGTIATASAHAKIYNNFLSVIGSYTGTVYGISTNACAYQDIAFNSINMNIPASFSFGVYLAGTTTNGAFLTNNIISNNGGGFAIFTGNTQPLAYSNFNDLFSTGPYLCYYTSNIATLSAWRSASGKDMNSVNVSPGFISNLDLHINNGLLNNAGIPVSGITTDIDGETRGSSPDIGADEFVPIVNDASVTSLKAPFPPCTGSSSLTVAIKNFGTAVLNSVTLNWEIDGVLQSPVSLSSLALAQYQETNVSLGTFTFSPSTKYNLKCWTVNPNGSVDGNHKNDTLVYKNLQTGMSGTYMIGSLTANYLKLNDALADLVSRGVCGAVVFRILAGSYNEHLEIPFITGASATNTITFESFDSDSTKVEIVYSASGTMDDYVVQFKGSEYVTFRKLSIQATGGSYGKSVVLEFGASHNVLKENIISCLQGVNSTTIIGIYNPATSNENDNLIENNLVRGGYYGIQFNGGSVSSAEKQNRIIGNRIINFTVYGISLSFERLCEVRANFISNDVNSQNAYGLYYSAVLDSCSTTFNKIYISASTVNYGIFLINCNGTATKYNLLANNIILQSGNSSGVNEGFHLASSTFQQLVYNTIKINAMAVSSGRALNVSSGSNLKLLNNIFANMGGGYALYIPATTILNSSDYNDLYTNGANLCFWNTSNISGISSWKSTTSMDIHSISVDPFFVSSTDLHSSSKLLDSAAIPFSLILYDMDNEPRNSVKPDIGADEFTLFNWDASVTQLVSPVPPCAGVSSAVVVNFRNNGQRTINNTSIKWSVNAVLQPPKKLSCAISPSEDTLVTVGTYTFTTGKTYYLKFWLDSLNGRPDENQRNDTLTAKGMNCGMNGTYTIGKMGKNYSSFKMALKELQINGVCGPVVLVADTGIFNEQLSIPEISGASPANTITFRSASSDSTKTRLQYQSLTAYDNYVVQLVGADYIRFEKMTLKALSGAMYSRVVELKGGACHNIFSNNVMISNSSMSGGANCVYNDPVSIDNFNVIQNNRAYYGNYSFSISGTSSTGTETGNVIKGNIIEGSTYYGIYAANQDSLEINGNVVTTSAAPFGIYTYYIFDNSRIINNKVTLTAVAYTTYGITTNYATGKAAKKVLIANNFIVISGSSTFQVNGINSSYCYFNKILHNTVCFSATGNNSNSSAVFFSSDSKGSYGNIDFCNNIVVNLGGSYAIQVDGNAASLGYLKNSDYNDLYTNGNFLGRYSKTDVVDLPAWITIAKKDTHSFNIMPPFRSLTDLHLKEFSTCRVNHHLAEVISDIDNESRSPLKPVCGADENPVFALDAGIVKLLNPQNTACEGLNSFSVRICNFGISTIDSVEISWKINAASHPNVKYKGSLAHLQETNVFLGWDSLFTGVPNLIQIKTIFPNGKNDQNPANDSLVTGSIKILPEPRITNLVNDTVCRNSNALLRVNGNSGSYLWYNSAVSSTVISEDSSMIVTNVTSTTPFFVEAVSSGIPDSISTQKKITFSQNMGNMFSVKALSADLFIDSFAVHPVDLPGTRIPLALWYKTGTYNGYEKDSNAWNFIGTDTVTSSGPMDFTILPLGNIKIKKGDSVSFYISSANDAYLLYSTDGANIFSNGNIRISTGTMAFYKFDSNFQPQKSWNGKIYYSRAALCKSVRDTVYAVVMPQPSPKLGNDTSFCRGQSVLLDAGGGKGFRYTWKYGSDPDTIATLQKLQVDSTGRYSVIVTDPCGFSANDKINIGVYENPLARFDNAADTQCFNENSFHFINHSSIVSGKLAYNWFTGDGKSFSDTNLDYSFKTAGIFTVRLVVVSDHFCTDSSSETVLVKPSPFVYLGKDTALKAGQSVLLDAGNGFDNYHWKNGSTSPTQLVDSSGVGTGTKIIWVRVSKSGCEAADTIKITFNPTSSVEGILNGQDVKIFPNPVSGTVNIQICHPDKNPVIMTLISPEGKIIQSESILNGEAVINMQNLDYGLYLIKIQSGNQQRVFKVMRK